MALSPSFIEVIYIYIYNSFLACILCNFVDIPDIPIISMYLLYKPDILNIWVFINIYGTYMVFIVIITVNPDT